MKSPKPTPNSGFFNADASVDGFQITYWTCGTTERKQQYSVEMVLSEDSVMVTVHGISKCLRPWMLNANGRVVVFCPILKNRKGKILLCCWEVL